MNFKSDDVLDMRLHLVEPNAQLVKCLKCDCLLLNGGYVSTDETTWDKADDNCFKIPLSTGKQISFKTNKY